MIIDRFLPHPSEDSPFELLEENKDQWTFVNES